MHLTTNELSMILLKMDQPFQEAIPAEKARRFSELKLKLLAEWKRQTVAIEDRLNAIQKDNSDQHLASKWPEWRWS